MIKPASGSLHLGCAVSMLRRDAAGATCSQIPGHGKKGIAVKQMHKLVRGGHQIRRITVISSCFISTSLGARAWSIERSYLDFQHMAWKIGGVEVGEGHNCACYLLPICCGRDVHIFGTSCDFLRSFHYSHCFDELI